MGRTRILHERTVRHDIWLGTLARTLCVDSMTEVGTDKILYSVENLVVLASWRLGNEAAYLDC